MLFRVEMSLSQQIEWYSSHIISYRKHIVTESYEIYPYECTIELHVQNRMIRGFKNVQIEIPGTYATEMLNWRLTLRAFFTNQTLHIICKSNRLCGNLKIQYPSKDLLH